MAEIPIWQQYTLSVEEAAEYFRIGKGRIRQLIAENPNADFVLAIGNHMHIKRKKFEAYIDEANVI